MGPRRSSASVVYDPDAHREFVTGFRKRKLQRRQHAEKKAAEQERQARIEERRQKREVIRANRKQVEFGENGEVSSGEEEEKQDEAQVTTFDGDNAVVTATVTPMQVGPELFRKPSVSKSEKDSVQNSDNKTNTSKETTKLGAKKELKKRSGARHVSFTHAMTKANKRKRKLKRAKLARK